MFVRKKDLIQQNLTLFDTLQKTQLELDKLKKQVKAYSNEIKALKSELSAKEGNASQSTEPMRRLEEKVLTTAALKPDVEYGSEVIGKIVISAADYSNRLTPGGDDSNKELINLILGKTELAKSEILSVTQSDDDFETKRLKIDQIAKVTNDYFESVAAQIV